MSDTVTLFNFYLGELVMMDAENIKDFSPYLPTERARDIFNMLRAVAPLWEHTGSFSANNPYSIYKWIMQRVDLLDLLSWLYEHPIVDGNDADLYQYFDDQLESLWITLKSRDN